MFFPLCLDTKWRKNQANAKAPPRFLQNGSGRPAPNGVRFGQEFWRYSGLPDQPFVGQIGHDFLTEFQAEWLDFTMKIKKTSGDYFVRKSLSPFGGALSLLHSRAARGERQKSFGTDSVAGMFLTLAVGEISLTALWRKGVTGLDMTSEISFYLTL